MLTQNSNNSGLNLFIVYTDTLRISSVFYFTRHYYVDIPAHLKHWHFTETATEFGNVIEQNRVSTKHTFIGKSSHEKEL